MTYDERGTWTLFLVNAFASLEDEMVRAQVLKLVSLPMWSTLAPKNLAAQLAAQPQLQRPWKFLQKRKAKEVCTASLTHTQPSATYINHPRRFRRRDRRPRQ